MTKMIKGIASSNRITMNKAYPLIDSTKGTKPQKIFSVDQEINRLNNAITTVKEELNELQNRIQLEEQGDTPSNFDIHLLILRDNDLIDQMKSRIQYENYTAELAWKSVTKKYIIMFEQMNTEYMKVRAQAIHYVSKLVLAFLAT